MHAVVLAVLVGGFFASRLRAQGGKAPAVDAASSSLLDRWLQPDAVIGGAVVLLYAGELRGDVKRLKSGQAELTRKLHDDYMSKETIDAKIETLMAKLEARK